MVNDTSIYDRDILEHHGILKQKWGHRNGPPYPLDPKKDYSKAELKAIRKQAKRDIRLEKKNKKKQNKEEEKEEIKKKTTEEELTPEEAKNRAIRSGSVSEVEKYKSKMTNEEFREAMNRITIEQEFKNLKIKEMQINNNKINEMANEIANKNSLRDKKMTELYGKGPKEAMLEKTTRIAGYLGKISNSANSLGIALTTFKKLQQSGDSNTKKEDNKTENKTKTKSNEKEIVKNISKVGVENISKKVNDYNKSSLNKRAEKKVKRKFKKESKKFLRFVEKEHRRFNKVKIKNLKMSDKEFNDKMSNIKEIRRS